MRLRLPRLTDGAELEVARVAFLFEHELAHCAGYEHSRMGPLNSWRLVGSGRYDYLAGLTIGRAVAKPPKPKADKQVERYLAALARLKEWNTKAKRAATAIKKYRAQTRRYEKLLGADGRLVALKSKTD